MKRPALLALATLSPLSSGCIAAAIPLVASAALVERVDDIKARAAKLDKAAEQAGPGIVSSLSDTKIVRTSLTGLPIPDGVRSAANPAIASFRSYVLAQSEIAPGPGKRLSAIVPGASDLRLVRGQCGVQPAAVFIDLDPGRGTFDPLAPGVADPLVQTALAELRERGVKVVWFSRLGANFAAAARDALVAGGLDPAGADELVLMTDIGERKQSLRDEVTKRLCPIAILGDERADFDELYLYLKNPGAALALDAMIGRGWFLASPFQLSDQAATATP